jgi:hypothetical protein
MSRRSAAWAAAITALLLTAAYLLTRRRRAAPTQPPLAVVRPDAAPTALAVPEPPAAQASDEDTMPVEVGASPEPVPALVETRAPMPVPSSATEPEAPTAPVPTRQVKSRSWQGRARPVLPAEAPTTTAVVTQEADEQPLPTWLRVTIVLAALVAFFAVSLIATKRV